MRPTQLLALSSLALVLACQGPPATQPARWTVWVAPDAPWAVQTAADDLVSYLTAMGREAAKGEGTPPADCVPGEGHALLAGDGIEGPMTQGASDQSWRIDETRCDGGGSRVALSGGGLLGRQYAVYEWLHRLGVRFFHPEEEYVPSAPVWPDAALTVAHTPAFRWRSVSLHTTHPLELGDAFVRNDPSTLDEGARYIDWSVKNGASRGRSGVGDGQYATRGVDRGLPLEVGFSLHDQQQGGHGIVNPDDPRTPHEQIAAAIDEQMVRDDGLVPGVFTFTFDPSEFTEVPDRQALDEIGFIADYMANNYPDTLVQTINHGTHGEPTATYGIRYFDLPELAPANLGVMVHTLMFYDLFRPAPVYGNQNFRFLYDFMLRNYQTRPLVHFPESAWWLTFDIAVPLYLPITIQARDQDIQSIAWMLRGQLDGHHVFGTGHEWGYWQNEYCSFRMAADLDYRWQDCLHDIVSPMGDAGPEVQRVVEDAVGMQERDILYGDVLPYIVGTDSETEVAASVGVVFHPLPPSPSAILRWDAARVRAWLNLEMPELQQMDRDYARLVERLNAVEPNVPDDAKPFFDEIRDGLEATGLRARHGWQVYGAVVTLRNAQLTDDATMHGAAQDLLDAAKATTQDALDVIHRREEGYRYAPLSRSIAGGPDGTEDDNWTIYHYRYLNRTHHGFYYTRIDDLASAAFMGGAQPVEVSDALLAPGETMSVNVLDATLGEITVDWGDGSPAPSGDPPYTHDYGDVGVYPFALDGRLGTEPYTLSGDVGALSTEYRTGFSGHVIEPSGVSLIEGVFPGLTFGVIDADRLAIGFSGVEEGTVKLGDWSVAAPAEGSTALFESAPTRLEVPIVDHATGAVSAHMVVYDAVLRVTDASSPAVLTGALDTMAVIEAVVSVGGFDMQGARRIVASTLGYTADTLPDRVDFQAEYTLSP